MDITPSGRPLLSKKRTYTVALICLGQKALLRIVSGYIIVDSSSPGKFVGTMACNMSTNT